MFELVNPVFLTKYEYSEDSAGAGEWRGGLGVETTFTFLDDEGQASIFGDGATEDTRAPGTLGGKSGGINIHRAILSERPNIQDTCKGPNIRYSKGYYL